MAKREPERTCISCRKKGDKSLFIKVVLNKNGDIAIERDSKLDGRGAYICKDEKCLLACKSKKALNRVFKTAIPENIYEGIVNGTQTM